jgi:hypothetical protein
LELPRRETPAKTAEVEAWLAGTGQRAVEELVREGQAAEVDERARRRYLLWFSATGLAAALLLAWLIVFQGAATKRVGPSGGTPLGIDELELLRPLDRTRTFEVFEWAGGTPPEGGSAEIRIEDQRRRGVALVQEPVTGSSWRPTPEQAKQLPDDLWWQVRVFDKLGGPVDSKECEVSLLRD